MIDSVNLNFATFPYSAWVFSGMETPSIKRCIKYRKYKNTQNIITNMREYFLSSVETLPIKRCIHWVTFYPVQNQHWRHTMQQNTMEVNTMDRIQRNTKCQIQYYNTTETRGKLLSVRCGSQSKFRSPSFKGGHNGQRGMEHITNGFKLVEPTTNILFSFFLLFGTNSHCNLGKLNTFCYLNI